ARHSVLAGFGSATQPNAGQARSPQSMRLLNIFYAFKAFKNNPFATGHGQRGFGVSGCFVYSI
ncbi:hypothetical protein, partial [Pseudomonas sp. PA-6-1H]|uniref:hypothetical protein n=1 Tax=Pseudomonas sp. PA-6-1H TaxID=2665482 RepID=UPI001F17E8E5